MTIDAVADTLTGVLAFVARWLIYGGLLYAVAVGSRSGLVILLAWVLAKDEVHALVTRAQARHAQTIATQLRQRGASTLMLRRRGC